MRRTRLTMRLRVAPWVTEALGDNEDAWAVVLTVVRRILGLWGMRLRDRKTDWQAIRSCCAHEVQQLASVPSPLLASLACDILWLSRRQVREEEVMIDAEVAAGCAGVSAPAGGVAPASGALDGRTD